jgi:stress responsive alpha/beta barrel protein
MMAHVVVFTPRPDLSEAQRRELAGTLASSLDGIPSVRRYQVGRRVKLGTVYDREAPLDFTFLVVIEFDNQDGLAAYLHHPWHEALGRLFYSTSEGASAADFETVSGDVATTLAAWAGHS